MSKNKTRLEAAIAEAPDADMNERHKVLCEQYRHRPETAMIVDSARTQSSTVPATEPLYGELVYGDMGATKTPIGVHKAVGGEGDLPIPGEILAGALAACLDSTIRIIANRIGVPIKSLEVSVEAWVDVRGTLRVDDTVPVGFQELKIDVYLQPAIDLPAAHLDAILKAAEQSCVVLQTLLKPPKVSVHRTSDGSASRKAA